VGKEGVDKTGADREAPLRGLIRAVGRAQSGLGWVCAMWKAEDL